MPNLLQRIEDLAQKVAPVYSNIHLIPRGMPYYIDPLLKGTLRFAKRYGAMLSALLPDNEVKLAEDVYTGNTALSISTTSNWIFPGQILLVDDSERVLIDDYDVDSGVITFDDGLLYGHTAGANISIWAFPVIVHEFINSYNIRIRSSYGIYNGDVVAIQSIPDNMFSFVETTILTSVQDGVYGTIPIYNVVLDSDDIDVDAGDMIYIRANPAYCSPILKIPEVTNRSYYIGPFVVDYLSLDMKDDVGIDETLSINIYDTAGVTSATPMTVEKNHPVLALPVDMSSMLFWDKIKGSIQYDGTRFIAITDDEGLWSIGIELAPSVLAGSEWRLPIIPDFSAVVTCAFLPNTIRTISAPAGITSYFTIGVSAGEKISSDRVVLAAKSNPNTEIKFGHWQTTGSQAESIQYRIVSTAVGSDVWQSSSMVLKPYFLTLESLSGLFDRYDKFDSGKVFL